MSRTRSAQRARMMRGMPTAQHPLVLRKGMRPVGYGYGGEMEDLYKAAYPNGFPCLYLGSKDVPNDKVEEPIRALALSLKERGYATEAELSEGIKGNYDANMKRAVEAFQRKNGLAVDGVVGPDTWGKLVEINAAPAGVGAQKCPPRYTGGGGGAGAGAGAGGRSAVSGGGARGTGGSITDKAWFWPVAILVPTAAVIGGILFWPKKKAQ